MIFARIRFKQWYLLLVFALFVIPVWYAVHQIGDESFWDGAFGNWLATMFGVMAGVPVAFEIDRWRTRRGEQRQQQQAKAKANNVLRLLRQELQGNLDRLGLRMISTDSLPLEPLRTNVWETFSASGEIKWIDDVELLEAISSAYHYARIVIRFEDMFFRTIRGINVQYPDGTHASQRIVEDARAFDRQLTASLTEALRRINESTPQDD